MAGKIPIIRSYTVYVYKVLAYPRCDLRVTGEESEFLSKERGGNGYQVRSHTTTGMGLRLVSTNAHTHIHTRTHIHAHTHTHTHTHK